MGKEILIAVVQGITEFFPISSSAHIALLEHLFNLFKPSLLREIVLHLATLLAILLFLRRKISQLLQAWIKGEKLNYLFGLVIGSFPAAFFGLIFKDTIEQAFGSVRAIGLLMMVNSLVLLLSRKGREKEGELSWRKALLIGVAQAFALFPGISRSGATITAGLLLGLRKEEAFDFSFLLAIPAILGASLLELKEMGVESFRPYVLPFLFAFIAGYAALLLLRRIVKKQKFYLFAPYVIIIGAIAFFAGG